MNHRHPPSRHHHRRRSGKLTVGGLFASALLVVFLLLFPVKESAPTPSEPSPAPSPASAPSSETDAVQIEAEIYSYPENEQQAETTSPSSNAPLTVHFIDVGQGDATLIESDGHYMLIDAGNNDKGTTVQLYLMQQGVTTLDYVIGTHPDADHIGGLDVIIYKFDCQNIFLPNVSHDTRTYEDVLQSIDDKGYSITHPSVGDTYTLGDASFTILAPNDDYGSDLNDWSIALLLENGAHRFLFSGDAGLSSEKDILANDMDISADVYKVAHHGSKTATSADFLSAISPSYAVISVGEDNSYGHPDAEVLNRLRAAGVQVFRTDEQGTITVTSDGGTLTWSCAPTESWQAGEH